MKLKGSKRIVGFSVFDVRSAFCSLVVFTLAVPVQGAVLRDVHWEATDRVTVAVRWSFGDALGSGLILEEEIPAGWIVDASALAGGQYPWRLHDDRLGIVIGLASGAPAEGTVTYTLSAGAGAGVPLAFSGRAYMLTDAQFAMLPVQGISTFDPSLPPPPPPPSFGGMQVWITGMQTDQTQDGSYLDIGLAVTPLSDDGFVGVASVASDALSELAVVVEYRELAPYGQWQGVYTSRPPERVSYPDRIRMPFLPPSGMLRLRLLDEEQKRHSVEGP